MAAISVAALGFAVPAASAATASQTATTPETLVIEPGSLELSGIDPAGGSFGTTDVKTVYDAGFTGTVDVAPTVSDFRGGDGVWSLSVSDDGGFATLGATLTAEAGNLTPDSKDAQASQSTVTVSTSDATVATSL